MEATLERQTASDPDVRRRAQLLSVALWGLSVLVAAGIGLAGIDKFTQPDRWRELFVTWGYRPAFSFVVGATEVIGAIALLVPRIALYGALALELVMLSALATLLTHSGGPMGWGATPLTYVVLLALIAAGRWRQRRPSPARPNAGG